MISPASLWALISAIDAVLLEYLYRSLPGGWVRWSWVYVPLQIFMSYAIYRFLTVPGTSLVDAFIIWSFSTVILRTGVSLFLLGDVIKPSTWAAFGLVLAARCVQAFWK